MIDYEQFFIDPPAYNKKPRIGAYVVVHREGIYIGSANDLYKRKSRNESNLRLNKHHCNGLQAAYNRDPKIQIKVFITDTREHALKIETELLAHYRSKGYNVFNTGGEYAHAPSKGIPLSEQRKFRLREINLGKTLSVETRRKIGLAGLGRFHTKEAKDKISLAKKDVPKSPEHVSKMREARKKQAKYISVNGMIYESIRGASRELGVHPDVMRKRLNSQKFPEWFFVDRE